MTIFDLVQAPELVAYWETLTQDRPPYLGEELFPNNKKRGLDLKWIKGSKGLPVVLNPSAFDVKAIPRDRIGFDKVSAQMPFFKESLYIDEELRQELNTVIETGNQAYIDSVINRVFDDEMSLLEGAAAQRERMRMQVLTTGAIAITANGEDLQYDYHLPESHKDSVTVSWSNTAANIVEDIRTRLDLIEDETGVRPKRGLCSRKTWNYIMKNDAIKKAIFVLTDGVGVMTDSRLASYLQETLDIEIVVYTKRFMDENKKAKAFVPDDVLVLFPEGTLGNTWFGTTPEESDLMSTNAANVSITDTGVAVTVIQHADPVNAETKVTMVCLPSFEAADQVFILDTEAAG